MEKEKVAVVTGGSKGIGAAICEKLANQNYKVYCLSRSEGKNKKVVYLPCDLANEQSIEEATKQILEKEKTIDVLINNAGMGISGATEFNKVADIKGMFDVNFFGAVKTTQCFIPKMREQGFGKIVFISSVASVFTLPYQTFYSATKKSINALVEGLRHELKQFNISVCGVLLGDIKTQFTASRQKSFDGDDVYGSSIENSIKKIEKDEQNGMSSDKVAKAVCKLLKRKKLPAFKTVGFVYKIFVLLDKLLPKAFVLWIVGIIYNKK